MQHLIIYPIWITVAAFEELGYNVSFSPYHKHTQLAIEYADDILNQKESYLEALIYCGVEDQKYEDFKSMDEEKKDIIDENFILNSKLENVKFDQQELDHLNNCIDVVKKIILIVNDSKFEKLK